MSNPFNDFGFHTRDGFRTARKFILYPFLTVILLTVALAAGLYAFNANKVPTTTPDLTNPEVVGQAATTDLYANALFSAMNCVRDYPEQSCDQDEKKTKLIISASQEILVINNENFPITDKDTLREVLTTTVLKDIEFTNLTTQQKGKKIDTITYTNSSQQTVIMNFGKNENDEVILKSIEVQLP